MWSLFAKRLAATLGVVALGVLPANIRAAAPQNAAPVPTLSVQPNAVLSVQSDAVDLWRR